MIRVLVVDDSPAMRSILSRILESAEDICVVGTARDPYEARKKIIELKPDVLTLDIEMPRMDGLTFLEKLMQYYPLPVVVISSFTPAGSAIAIQALEQGAVEVMEKPGDQVSFQENARAMASKIRLAAHARLRGKKTMAQPAAEGVKSDLGDRSAQSLLLAIGASTGGPEALRFILRALPADIPGTVIVQHMPKQFTAPFARRLNEITNFEVREAADGDMIKTGLALIAPGGMHMVVQSAGERYRVELRSGPKVFSQRPSVEVLFNSVAKAAKAKAVGVLLTGMGSDGANGLLGMRQAGAVTLAQDAESCVVYGMPKVAAEIGAAETIAPLEEMPRRIIHAFNRIVQKRKE